MGDYPGQIKWIEPSIVSSSEENDKSIEPRYSRLGERIRNVTPTNLQCSMFCGGKQCKYCNSTKFKTDEMAIKGLFSSWVTDKILATSRPTSFAIKEYDIINQFHQNGITTIINLQHSGEHSTCGPGLEESGFSYVPQDFMDNNVFFYNFGWNDYGVRSLQSILDMVKVMDFAISKGKVAIHCHAGLGRTGVLIACYLIYSKRYSSEEAILAVRTSRPKAIQTRGQIRCVKEFERYLNPMWVLFTEEGEKPITLSKLMHHQRAMLHGEEGRVLKYVPKIVLTICRRLLTLCDIDFDLSACLQITRFNFMVNSNLNSESNTPDSTLETVDTGSILENEDNILESSDGGNLDAENSDCGNSEDGDNNSELCDEKDSDEKYNSDENDCDGSDGAESDEINSDLPAKSIRDLIEVDSEKTVGKKINPNENGNDVFVNPVLSREAPSKKGGIFLDPLPLRRKQKSKKPGRRKKNDKLNNHVDHFKDIHEINSCTQSFRTSSELSQTASETNKSNCEDEDVNADSGEEDEGFLSSSISSTISQKSQLSSISRFDDISLASFSSASNEDLGQNDLTLKYLAFRCSDIHIVNQTERFKRKLNSGDGGWVEVDHETNIAVLSSLLWSWLSNLQCPIASSDVIEVMKAHFSAPEDCLGEFSRDFRKLVECFLTFLAKLNGRLDLENRVLRRFAMIMTGKSVPHTIQTETVLEDSDDTGNNGLIFLKFVLEWLRILKQNFQMKSPRKN